MLRKIFKTGNSMAVSLPSEILEPLGVSDGSEVSVVLEDGKIVIRPMQQTVPGVDEEFARQLAEFIDEYRPALESWRSEDT
jgi:antitoxin component of MazEF toxin-antitoxin module